VKTNVKGPKAGRDKADKMPPVRPTYVAPALPTKRAANASITAWTTIRRLLIGGGTKKLATNIIELNNAVMNIRLALCTTTAPFLATYDGAV
jgi:hypothetical protein